MNHLSVEQLEGLRQQLLREQNRLRETISQELLDHDSQQFSDLAGRVHDAGEESVADLLADLDMEMIRRHKEELQEVEAALERMAQGRYGICQDSAEPIAYERLKVQPTARRSAEMQRRWEQSHYGVNRPTL